MSARGTVERKGSAIRSRNKPSVPATVEDEIARAAVIASGDLAAHVADTNPHVAAGFQKASEKNAASGYAGLDGSTKLTGSQQKYGSAANTACEGNDGRLSDARTPLAHTHPESDITNLVADLAAKEATANKNVNGGYPGLTTATSFTPGVSFGGASVGVTYSSQTGSYMKFANCIVATFSIGLTSKGSSTGSLKFTGLPVAPDGKNYAVHIRCSGLVNTVTGTPQGIMSSTATTITVEQLINGANSDLTDAHVNNTSSFVVTLVYFV